jgi:uncharacterized protein YndB with AHSA1/START domain
MSDPIAASTGEKRITVTRVLNAPREVVFKAWTDPEQLARWFGPEGFEVRRDSVTVELREGGRFELTMVGPGGGMEFPLRYQVLEFIEPELLVLRSDPMPQMGLPHGTVARIELQAQEGKTRLTIIDGPYPVGGEGAEAGWVAAFRKLETVVARS